MKKKNNVYNNIVVCAFLWCWICVLLYDKLVYNVYARGRDPIYGYSFKSVFKLKTFINVRPCNSWRFIFDNINL